MPVSIDELALTLLIVYSPSYNRHSRVVIRGLMCPPLALHDLDTRGHPATTSLQDSLVEDNVLEKGFWCFGDLAALPPTTQWRVV